MLELKELIIYKVGLPQIPNNIDRIELYANGYNWIKVSISKGVDFESQNLYDIMMYYKSALSNRWEIVSSWEYRLSSGKGLVDIIEKGKVAFSDPDSIYSIGIRLEDEIENFEKRKVLHKERLEIFNTKIKPEYLSEDKENELKIKTMEDRAKKIDEESKRFAIEIDFKKIKDILGNISLQKEKEIKLSLTQKYFGENISIKIQQIDNKVQTLEETTKHPVINENDLVIDIGQAN